MLTPADLNNKVLTEVFKNDISEVDSHLGLVASGQYAEVYNRTGQWNLYYQWLFRLVQITKPKQIVELGAAAGISTLLMAVASPESKIYSVDYDPQAWRWMKEDYPNVVKILGDTRDMNIWPKDVDLGKTDLWFFDSEHLFEVLNKEVELYKPFWKKDAIVVFDDIHLNEGMEKVWNSLDYPKCDNTNPCHYSGFGFLIL